MSRQIRALSAGLSVVTVVVLTTWGWQAFVGPDEGSAPSPAFSTVSGGSAAPSSATGSDSPRPAPSVRRAEPALSGRALARAWLTAFLTRSDRDDQSWLTAVSRLSSPDVVDELRAEGPDAVGLTSLRSWKVARIDPIAVDDRPLDTPTRQVLAFAATVTDGVHRVQKPFVLYAYLDPDGRWRVEQVEQPYSSEG